MRQLQLSLFLLLLVLLLAAAPAWAQDATRSSQARSSYASGHVAHQGGIEAGRARAEEQSVALWGVGGFAGGAAGSLVGAGLAYGLASRSKAEDAVRWRMPLIKEHGMDYWMGFERGYRGRMQDRKQRAAPIGGLAGVTVSMAAVILLTR